MRKGVKTYPALGVLRFVKYQEFASEVLRYYPHAFRKHDGYSEQTYFNNQVVGGVTQPVMVAHGYARDIKKLNDLWYIQMILPEGAETREQRLLREHREKQRSPPRKRFVLRFKKLEEFKAKQTDPFFKNLMPQKERDAYYDSLPEKEIRRRQDLCNQQLRKAHDTMNNKALSRLSVMEDDLTRAMMRR